MNLRTLKGQVEAMLHSQEETRNNDITLTLAIWQKFYPHLIRKGSTGEPGVWLRDIFKLPREDNVKRVRAKFQNEENKYLPTDPKVREARGIEEDKWRAHLGYEPKQ